MSGIAFILAVKYGACEMARQYIDDGVDVNYQGDGVS